MSKSDDATVIAALFKAGGTAFGTKVQLPSGATLDLPGMTLRDYFAAQALAGMLANGFIPNKFNPESDPDHPFAQGRRFDYSASAYEIADTMLAERQK